MYFVVSLKIKHDANIWNVVFLSKKKKNRTGKKLTSRRTIVIDRNNCKQFLHWIRVKFASKFNLYICGGLWIIFSVKSKADNVRVCVVVYACRISIMCHRLFDRLTSHVCVVSVVLTLSLSIYEYYTLSYSSSSRII